MTKTPRFPTPDLLRWFEAHRRDLPWRRTRDPYAVWISEIMCQQTRVATVIPYFERWMHAFPTVQSLAAASEDAVFRLWQGLGYYSRANNLRRAAKVVTEVHGGQFPRSKAELQKLPGIGPYTAAAIASIVFGEHVGVVDGNVLRVLARYYGIDDDIRLAKNTRQFWALADAVVADVTPGDANQALMELGSLVCTPRNPSCASCPASPGCHAFRTDSQHDFPVKSPKPKPRDEHRFAFRIEREDGTLPSVATQLARCWVECGSSRWSSQTRPPKPRSHSTPAWSPSAAPATPRSSTSSRTSE